MHFDIIRDSSGHHYRLHILGDPPVPDFLQAKHFPGSAFAASLVRKLRVPPGFWRRALSNPAATNFNSGESEEGRISTLLLRGTFKLYPVKHLDTQQGKTPLAKASLSLPAVNGKPCMLAPASVLLVQPRPQIKTFTGKEQAVGFLTNLKMNTARRNTLATEMGISQHTPDPGRTNSCHGHSPAGQSICHHH